MTVVTDLLSGPSVAFPVLLGGISMFVYQSVTSFFPTFLVEFREYFSWGGVLQSRVIAALSEGEEKHGSRIDR